MTNVLKTGNVVMGKVTGIEPYGIFVQFDNDYSGLVHISEVSEGYVRNVNDFVALGENIYCQILEINEDEKRLKLSIKDINYKEISKVKGVNETRMGFFPLKEHLPIWIEEKLKIYKN